MPWDIKKNDKGEHCLFKKDDGSMVKGSCHKSRSETAKMMRAMYASEGGKQPPKKMEGITLAKSKYEIKKQMMSGKEMHCVMDGDGTMVKGSCREDRTEAMKVMKEMMGKEEVMMENVQLALSMKNPVWLGCAVTNRPHIRLKEHPLSIVEIDGKKFIRVPMMRAGKYHHPQGDLDMTGDVLNQFIQNHDKSLADFEVVLDAKHQPDRGALGLFEKKHGAFVQREKADKPQIDDPNGELLIAYGIPTGDDAIEAIEKGKFRHASMEFHPDYHSNVERTYLSSDLREIDEMIDNVQLGGPGSGRKRFGSSLRKVGSTLRSASPFATRQQKLATRKKIGTGLKKFGRGAKKVAKKVGKFAKKNPRLVVAGALIGAGVAGSFRRRKYEAGSKSIQLNSFLPLYEMIAEYVEESPDDHFVWLDKEVFNFSELNLPEEEGHYKVDKQTAEEMLAALDELAQDEQFADLFDENYIESEDDMPDDLDVVEETTQELQVRLEAAETASKAANARIVALERQATEAEIKAVVAEARTYVDEHGMGHAAVLLNLVQNLMLGNPIGEGDGSIQLEDGQDATKIATYFRRGLAHLLKTVPGQVKLEGRTTPESAITLERTSNINGLYEQGRANAANFWGKAF